MDVKKVLQSAINNGEILTIRYHGGRQPGASREIAPIQITGNKVRAHCYASNAVKLFNIEKIEVLDNQLSNQNKWISEKPNIHHYENLHDVFAKTKKTVEELGYYPKLADNCYSLHHFFKNGKPRKSSVISIDFEEYDYEYDFDFESDSEYLEEIVIGKIKRQKPWVVRSKGKTTRTFSNLDKAVVFFIEQAKDRTP